MYAASHPAPDPSGFCGAGGPQQLGADKGHLGVCSRGRTVQYHTGHLLFAVRAHDPQQLDLFCLLCQPVFGGGHLFVRRRPGRPELEPQGPLWHPAVCRQFLCAVAGPVCGVRPQHLPLGGQDQRRGDHGGLCRPLSDGARLCGGEHHGGVPDHAGLPGHPERPGRGAQLRHRGHDDPGDLLCPLPRHLHRADPGRPDRGHQPRPGGDGGAVPPEQRAVRPAAKRM